MTTRFAITGMHCASCVARLEAALKPFARHTTVTLSPPQVLFDGLKPDATIDVLSQAVASAGAYKLEIIADAVGAAPTAAPPSGVSATSAATADDDNRTWISTYWPLIVIAGYIAIASFAGTATTSGFDGGAWMMNFMAGFFLVFSAFKFLDLNGFADAYATYDWLAKRDRRYGLIYPFLELALGLAFLFRIAPTATLMATVLLMGFSSLGVIQAVSQKQRIPCACLGTSLNLPMSTITIVEDLGMVAMAMVMLLA